MTTAPRSWHAIWERKGRTALPADPAARTRVQMDVNGYDTALGGVSEAALRDSARLAARHLRLDADSRVLDVGCGAGAFLAALDPRPAERVGVDYSASSVALAREALDGTFLHAEAGAMDVGRGRFDAVLSVGAFIYFPDLAYTRRVIRTMAEALRPGGRGLLADLMDADRRDEREALRRADFDTEAAYRAHYDGLEHLYHSRQWVAETLADLGCRSEEVPFYGPDYGYDGLAFHVLFEAPGGREA